MNEMAQMLQPDLVEIHGKERMPALTIQLPTRDELNNEADIE
jgi:hypothetical protein